MKARFSYWIISLFITLFAACKKDSTEPKQECRLSYLNLNGNAPINFTYDEQGRVTLITKGDEITTFTYSAGSYIRQTLKGNKLTEKSTIELNSQGLMQKISWQSFNNNGDIVHTTITTYEYNSNGELLKSTNNFAQVTTYTWENGNLTLMNNPAGITSLTYYIDKPAQPGDILYNTELQSYGRKVVKNKNLVKSIASGGSVSNITYEFDSNVKIIKVLLGNDYYIVQQACQ